MLPRISIVTPSYNQGAYLEQAIRSVLDQGYPNLEYIIIDGGSADSSVAIIKRYAGQLAYWVSERDRGQSHALNKGFERATGEILGWMCADDYFMAGALMEVARLYRERPDAAAWVGGCRVLGENDAELRIVLPRLGDSTNIGDWWRHWQFFQPSCLFSARLFREVGALDERLHYVMDVDLWLRLAQKGDFVPTDKLLSVARLNAETKSLKNLQGQETEIVAMNVLRGDLNMATRILARKARDAAACAVQEQSVDDVLRIHPFSEILDSVSYGRLLHMFPRYMVRRALRAFRFRQGVDRPQARGQ